MTVHFLGLFGLAAKKAPWEEKVSRDVALPALLDLWVCPPQRFYTIELFFVDVVILKSPTFGGVGKHNVAQSGGLLCFYSISHTTIDYFCVTACSSYSIPCRSAAAWRALPRCKTQFACSAYVCRSLYVF